MRPVDQTVFGSPHGNCMAACVASLLEVPLAEVPQLNGEGWGAVLEAWLRPRGFTAVCLMMPGDWRPPCLYVLAGKSPRGDFNHAVVARGNEVVHDPHPSRAGVLSHLDATLLVPLDPAGAR